MGEHVSERWRTMCERIVETRGVSRQCTYMGERVSADVEYVAHFGGSCSLCAYYGCDGRCVEDKSMKKARLPVELRQRRTFS